MASRKQHRERSLAQPKFAPIRPHEAARALDPVQVAGDGDISSFFMEPHAEHPLLETVAEGVVIIAPTGAIADCNSPFIRLVQRSCEEVIGTDFRDLVVPEQRQRFEALLAQARDGDARGEFALLNANETLVTVQLSLRNRNDGGQEPTYMVVTDLSEYKHAGEQAHRFNAALERRIANLVEASADAIFGIDLESRISDVNSQACVLTGFARHELIGSSFEELFTNSELAGECLSRALAEGLVKNFELNVRRHDGSELAVELSAWAFANPGGEAQTIGVAARDVGQRHHKERERSLLATIVRSSNNAIYSMTPDTIITSWNRGAEDLYGFSAEEMIGRSAAVCVPLGRRTEMLEHLRQAINCKTSQQFDTVRQRKDGKLIDVSITKSPITDENGFVIGASVSAHDITERKRLAQELTRARDAALEADRMRSEFLANMSHEVRTPLNSVLGMTAILLDTALSEEQRECALTMQKSGETLLSIVNDILDFSKMTAGKLSFEQIDLNVEAVVGAAFDMIAEHAQRKGLELVIAISPDVPRLLRGDPKRLHQVLVNLLNNAVKFTERGEVVMHVRSLGETADEATLRFEVRDTGIGIPSEAQERLFQAFSQVDVSDSREHGGTGLGLAIARELVERMGGTIGVLSERGVGSTFWFTAKFANQTGAVRMALPDVPNLEGLQVLVVDDNATSREIIRRLMMSWKIAVDTAAGAQEALRLLDAQARAGKPYKLALLDLDMPGVTGLELARLIRSQPPIARTELMIMSSMIGEAHYRARAAQLNIKSWLLKPIGASALLEALSEAFLGGSTPAAASAKTGDEGASLAVAAEWLGGGERRLRALVAEDNATNRKVALWHLEKLGFAAEAVNSGSEALDALARASYDVVLMDCRMPKMSGYDTTRRIREREGSTQHTKIIAMTAHALAGDREKCIAAGMDDYVSKPIKMDNLVTVLRRVLTRNGERGSAEAGAADQSAADQNGEPAGVPASSAATSAAPESVPSGARAQRPTADGSSDADGADVGGSEQASVLDAATIESLRMKEDLLAKLVEIFLKEVPEQLEQAAQALEHRDGETAAILAHSLKGAAATFGATRMRELAESVERAADQAGFENARDGLELLCAECGRVRRALEAEIKTHT